MTYIISFVLSVAASVVGYYICKWLDRHEKSGKHPEKTPGVTAPGVFVFV